MRLRILFLAVLISACTTATPAPKPTEPQTATVKVGQTITTKAVCPNGPTSFETELFLASAIGPNHMIFIGGRVEVEMGNIVEDVCHTPRKEGLAGQTDDTVIKLFEITEVGEKQVNIKTVPGVELVGIK